MPNKLKVGIIAQSCHPDAGSEPGATWAYLKRIMDDDTKAITVYLLSRDGNVEAIRRACGHNQNVEFKYVSPPSERLLAGGYLGQVGQFLWHIHACKALLADYPKYRWDVIHQISPNNSRLVNPIFLFRKKLKDVKLIWGPVGGFDYVPFFSMMRARYFRVALYAATMNVIVWFYRHLYPLTRAAYHNADHILAATGRNVDFLRARAGDVLLLREVGVDESAAPPQKIFLNPQKKHFVWAGSLIDRKNPLLLLDAISSLTDVERESAQFHVLGAGKMLRSLKARAKSLGIGDAVDFVGVVDRSVVRQYLGCAEALLITSVREINTTVLMEALEVQCPVLSTDVGGVAEIVVNTGGNAVPFSERKLAKKFGAMIRDRLSRVNNRVDPKSVYQYSAASNANKLLMLYEGRKNLENIC